jgi:hypothetical protein
VKRISLNFPLMRSCLVVSCVVLSGVTFAADKLPDGAAAYDIFPDSERPHLIKAYVAQVKSQTRAIESAKKNVVRAKDKEKESAQEAVEKTKAYFERLKTRIRHVEVVQ